AVALVGGGSPRVRPGEVTLAHRGVLFLDETPEFPSHVLEALRQPLEERVIRISRASGTIQLPADFLLVACANPCPCGRIERDCRCRHAHRPPTRARAGGSSATAAAATRTARATRAACPRRCLTVSTCACGSSRPARS